MGWAIVFMTGKKSKNRREKEKREMVRTLNMGWNIM